MLAVRDVAAASADAAPVAFILRDTLGTSIEKVFLVFICVSIFACGLVIMVTNSRLAFSMSRDRRLPGHQLLRRVPRATGGPTWATLAVCAVPGAIALGVVVYALMWLLEPEAMRSQPGAMGEEALEAGEEEPPPPPRAPQGAGGVPVRTGR